MKTLININNHSKITVPDIFIGGCCYIFNEDFLNMKQQDGNIFLNKDEWILEEPDCVYNHTLNNPHITIGTKIRSKANPDLILSIISNDCHEDEFECSNGSVLSLKQIEKYYDIIK